MARREGAHVHDPRGQGAAQERVWGLVCLEWQVVAISDGLECQNQESSPYPGVEGSSQRLPQSESVNPNPF